MLGRSIPKHALTSSDPCATAAVSVSFGWPGTSHAPAFFPTGGEDFYLPPGLRIRTLALLTIFLGAKLGANDRRHRAMSGHVQPFLGQMNSTSSHTRRRQAVFRECLLSSRSRVRVAVGAQIVLVDLRNRNYHRSSDVLLAGNHSHLVYRLADAQAGTRSPGGICGPGYVPQRWSATGGAKRGANVAYPASRFERSAIRNRRAGLLYGIGDGDLLPPTAPARRGANRT